MKHIFPRDRNFLWFSLFVVVALLFFTVSFFDFGIPFWGKIYDRLIQLFGAGSVALLIATVFHLFVIVAVPIFLLLSPFFLLHIIRQRKQRTMQGDVMHLTIWIAILIVIFSLLIVWYIFNSMTLGVFSPWQ